MAEISEVRTNNPFRLFLGGTGHLILLSFNNLYPNFVGEKDLQRLMETHSKRMDTANKKGTERQSFGME